jgi:hypothetical protein
LQESKNKPIDVQYLVLLNKETTFVQKKKNRTTEVNSKKISNNVGERKPNQQMFNA